MRFAENLSNVSLMAIVPEILFVCPTTSADVLQISSGNWIIARKKVKTARQQIPVSQIRNAYLAALEVVSVCVREVSDYRSMAFVKILMNALKSLELFVLKTRVV